jgi:acyl-ACP thioesterase
VRFDEAGPDGLLRASGLLRYVQDVAWQHSDDLGFDRAWYATRGVVWLVRAAELVISGAIPMGSRLEVTTSVVGHRKVWARRRSEALLDGAVMGWAHTDWVLVDGRGAPVRIPAEIDRAFPNPIAAFQVGRVELPDLGRPARGPASRMSFRVRPHELDPNDHVNNATYVDWLEEALPERAALAVLPRRYRLEYVSAAGPSDHLEADTWSDDRGWSVRLRLARGPAGAGGPDGDGGPGRIHGPDVVRARLEL